MRNVAISACLLGEKCRYDAKDNRNNTLLALLKDDNLIAFCPEEDAFGTPRPTMDLVQTSNEQKAISNSSGKDLSFPINQYAIHFFDAHPEIDLFIGKDRSPSCGVCSAKLYDEKKNVLSTNTSGLMAKEAKCRNITSEDAETFVEKYGDKI